MEAQALTEIFLSSLQRYEKDYGIRSAVAGSEGVDLNIYNNVTES